MKNFLIDKIFRKEFEEAQELAYSKGYGTGVVAERSKVLLRLEHHSVEPFKDDAVTLGYKHAIEAVKDSLARH